VSEIVFARPCPLPSKPAPPCRVCRKLHCSDPAHKPKPFAYAAPTRDRRPDYDRERRRRRKFVRDQLNMHGVHIGDGVWAATCATCGRSKSLPIRDWLADHITPVSAGGSESGPLRLSCVQCQRRQGGHIGSRNAKERR